ncbi:MAG: 2-oxoacid:acceptor oxidoreductase family protein, partial [Promethearchaeota archaeon]
ESLKELTKEVISIEATDLAIRAGNVVSTNVVMLGGLSVSAGLPLTMEDIKASIIEIIPKNKHEMNLKAFEFGVEAV